MSFLPLLEKLFHKEQIVSFKFVGRRQFCGNYEPHPPHVIDYYDDFFGKREIFCTGIAGNSIEIFFDEYKPGENGWPYIVRGYYVQK